MKIRLGTRSSALAIAQSEWVASQIRHHHPSLEIELVEISTLGDRSQAQNTPLSSYSEKGIFAKELEDALLAGTVDLAVHSMKDLAATLPDGLIIAAIPVREDPRDCIVGAKLADLPIGAKIGTGSVRRAALLREIRPDLQIAEIRGNVDTRLKKLADGQYDAIVLAVAGLKRLGRADVISEKLDPLVFIPDPGQGALAIQVHRDRTDVCEVVRCLNNPTTAACVQAERAYLLALGGGCSTPIGAWANFPERQFMLNVMMFDGERVRRAKVTGDTSDPISLGNAAADTIRE